VTVALRTIAAWMLFAGAMLSCGQPAVIDGLPLGSRVDGDERFRDFAIRTLDDALPGHALISSVEMYTPAFRNAAGDVILTARSGGADLIVVLNLADGSRRAFYVGCGVGLDRERCFLGPPDFLLHPE